MHKSSLHTSHFTILNIEFCSRKTRGSTCLLKRVPTEFESNADRRDPKRSVAPPIQHEIYRCQENLMFDAPPPP